MAFVAPSILVGAIAGAVNSSYDYVPTISPGTYGPPYTIALAAGALPPGLSFSTTTAEITGIPTTAGTFNYSLTIFSNANSALTSTTADSIVIAPGPTPCTDLGRVTRCYVSGYTRDRVHNVSLMAQEKRCLVANFNGALAPARKIASVVWSVSNPMFVNLSQADITGRETACALTAQWRGSSLVRCSATMDNGEVYTQYFAVSIKGYWFQGDAIGVQGPYHISAP